MKYDKALNNRKRVWKLARNLQALLDRIEKTCCSGMALISTFEPNAAAPDTMSWITANQEQNSQILSLYSGRNSLFQRMIEVPLDIVNVYVSIVEFYGHTHITGIRMETENGQQTIIGYNKYKDEYEKLLTVTARIHLAGFMVVADRYSITGIAVIATSGIVSRWIGANKGFPKRRLVLDSSPNPKAVRYIKAGFDVSTTTETAALSNSRCFCTCANPTLPTLQFSAHYRYATE